MKKIVAILFVLTTAPPWSMPVASQTGDCFDETGSSTTWEVTQFTSDIVRVTYTFYNGSDLTLRIKHKDGNATEIADDRCEFADREVVDREHGDLSNQICDKPANPENLVPAFPEVIATDANAPTVEEARQRELHREMIREFWPNDTPTVMDCLLDLWEWINTQGPVTFRRDWWNISLAEDGEANSRFGSLTGAESILEQDKQYLDTQLEDYQ